MTDLNVALRLRLENQMKAGAADAKRDLQKLKAEAERLGKVRGSVSPDAVRGAQQTRQIETQKALAVERTTAAIRRQRSEMLATDLAARRVDRAREVRNAREVQRAQRDARALQSVAAVAAARGVDWGPRGGLIPSEARRRRAQMMATTLAATRSQRAAEARSMREAHAANTASRPSSSAAASPSRGPGIPGAVAGAGAAAAGRAAGLSYGKALVSGLGIGIGAAAVGEYLKESILGAANDEFERDQLRVLGNISEAQMERYRKTLDKTARLRGIGSAGALDIFGRLMGGGLTPDEAAKMTDNVAVFAKATRSRSMKRRDRRLRSETT